MIPQEVKPSLLDARPKIPVPLDPNFQPLFLANCRYRETVAGAPKKEKLAIALERNAGLVTRWDVEVFPPDSPAAEHSFRYVERAIKFLLWARGGWKIHLAGPQTL